MSNIDGGRTGSGNATDNTVNIGDGQAAYTGSISGNINGGSSSVGGRDYTTGNKLNVYANAAAGNINNFAEINFRFNEYVNKNAIFLTLNGGGDTTIRSLSDINVHGAHAMKGTLLKKTSGVINVSDGNDRLVKTMSDANKEFVFAKKTNEITYEGYSFAHQTAPTTAPNGADKYTWGGRSVGGNSTHHNAITVNSGNDHTNVYGGWTSGTGTTATDKDGSYQNEVTLDGTAETGNLYGGYTDAAAGKVKENKVTVKGGEVTDKVYGGVADKVTGTGHVKKNIVNVSGGTVNTVYGGYTAGRGEALENEVNVIGGTLNGSIHGGYSTGGAATHNTVTLGNGTTVNGDVTGGEGTTTTGNIVNLNGTTVHGAVKGGTVANGTGNTLNVKGENSAQSVEGFQKMNFNTDDVAANRTMLNVTGGTQTKVNWNTLTAGGNGRNITLMRNNNGIDFGGTYTVGAVKSGLSADKKSETNVSVSSDQKAIEYTGYQFTGVSGLGSAVGGNLYGGISKAGNATHTNNITVNGSYAEVYGGHTSGTSNTDVEKKNSYDNTVTITGGTLGKVYGGYTDVDGGTTENNTVNLGDGTNALAPNTMIAEIHGGNKSAKGNTLNVNTAATVGKIENFSTVAFKNAASKLTLT